MKKALLFVIITSMFAAVAYGDVVTATSISSGVYEDGKFTRDSGSFKATYIIDEAAGIIVLDKVIENNREGRSERGAEYEITNAFVSKGPSALLVSRNKKDQKIFTAVREGDLAASETLIIGQDFYEYCKAYNGKFYLEYGEVTRGR